MPDLRALMQLMRLPAVFTAWSNIIAAHLIATAGHVEWRYLIWTVIASSAIYLAGMVLNDCFDLSEDRRDRPGRPLPSGAVPVRFAWLLGAGLLAAGLTAAALAGTRVLFWAVPLIGLVVLYDGGAKHGRFGEVTMAGCRYLNWIMGLSVMPVDGAAWLIPLPIFLYTLSLTTLSAIEVDSTDRQRVAWSIAGMVAAGLSMIGLTLLGVLADPLGLVAAGALFVIVIMRLLKVRQDTTPETVQAAMKTLIIGIIPLDAALLATDGRYLAAVLLLLLLIPSKILSRRIYIT
ncbi:MAG: UbiA family prenyltransferase [Gammaproteobacteria bacterium]|nr:UbiA family prenyltransferase [Gammaproteobacteria bacterium]MCP5299760.1 UbiA family prenyltransferase [Chromatiaceae bacterium]